jgi:gliding motility-associated-like protein
VKLVVTDASGCKDSVIKVNHFRTTKPKASFDMSDSVALCPPLFVSFTNTSSADGIIHFWDFDNGSTSAVKSPVSPFIDSGVYHVILVATDKYGCTDTAMRRVRIMGYDGALKYTPVLGCAPLTVDFEAELITADVMVWDFADGVTENAVGKPKTRHTYVSPGKYVPQLILGDGKGCSTSSKGIDTITVDDVIPRIWTSPACIGETITLTDSSKGVFSDYASSDWLLDDGSNSTSRSVTRRYDKPGSYPVRLISTNTNGCIDTLYQNLVVHALPVIKVEDTVICLNDAATLMASGGVSYDWQPDPTLSCTNCAAPQASPRVRTIYYVTGTDANGCKNTDTVTVGIKTKTTLIFDDQLEVCEKTPVVLQVSGAQTYTWIPPLYLDDANKQNPTATLDTSITYLVIGREGSCIPDTAKIRAVVHPLPEVHAGDDQRVLAGSMVSLNGNGVRVKDYLWQPGDSLVCPSCPVTQYRAQKTMTFTLKGFSDYGCVDSDDVTIVVFCDQSQLFIPNTFTPNGDGQNDVFYPQGSGVGKVKAFRIYNRWGQLVFERMNMDVNARDQGWDGTFKGEQLSPDVYVYTLEAACDNGEEIFWKGDIAIIR